MVVLGSLLLGWSDNHYWDEYLYLYSAFAHTPTELVAYELQTVLFPVGFFTEKIAHVVLLHLLTAWLGPGEGVLIGLQVLYTLFLVGLFGAAFGLARELTDERRARDATLMLMLTPLALWFTFKIMSEVPSLLLVTLGSWAFVRSFREDGSRRTVALALAVLGLAAGMLFRVTAIVAFASLAVALLAVGGERFPRKSLMRRVVVVGTLTALIHTAGLALVGGSVLRVAAHVHNVLTTHPPLQRVFALVLFLQTLALALVFAWGRRREPGTRLAWVWLVAAAAPFLAGHEPRYYVPALVPLAMVSAVGLRVAADRVFGPRLATGLDRARGRARDREPGPPGAAHSVRGAAVAAPGAVREARRRCAGGHLPDPMDLRLRAAPVRASRRADRAQPEPQHAIAPLGRG